MRILGMNTTTFPTVLLAPSADLARETLLRERVLLTVEAEYGSYVAEGLAYTAAHHQPRGVKYAGTHVGGVMPSPCNDWSVPDITTLKDGEGGVILVSHLDLDTFGGCLRGLGADFADLFPSQDKPSLQASNEVITKWVTWNLQLQHFWNLAEFIDVSGAHKLGLARERGATLRSVDQLYAWWAWNKAHSARTPRDVVTDVTDAVLAAGAALRLILAGDAEMLEAGTAFRKDEAALNTRSFARYSEAQGVIVRRVSTHKDFCNHLYTTPSEGEGTVAKAIACLNTETGGITISLADPVPGVSCREIVQDLWGPEAGGHEGIAGSPRERRLTEDDLEAVVTVLSRKLATAG